MPPCLGVRAPLAGACVSKKRTATRSLSFWVRPMASFSSLNWPSYLVCVCVAFLPLSVLLSTSFNATASHLSLPLDELFLYQNISEIALSFHWVNWISCESCDMLVQAIT